MNRPSEPAHRRGPSATASVVLGWLFVLCALITCCSLPGTAPAAHHSDAARAAAAARTVTPVHQVAVPTVRADAPEDRSAGSSCHGTPEHTAPVVISGQSAPVAPPGVSATAPAVPLTGAATIRGPSNDAVREVDHLRLQVQRI
ncbi:hypothetical protein [Streptomyces sp. NPDC014734]|uniref:hypothetical protein n=1 Tax=Streptomyces sp. NPDC014734 TaxID=3364886 RepID=UPI0036FCE4C0